MAVRVLSKDERRFFTTTYRLAQQSLEGYVLWTEWLPHLKLRRTKFWEAISFNEDLLRILITNTKRAFVVTTYIVSDNSKRGNEGHNVFKLLAHSADVPGFDLASQRKRLEQPEIKRAIRRVRLLRNNLDAHHSVSEDWKEPFGEMKNSEMEILICTLYDIVREANIAAGFRRVSESCLRKTTSRSADRLLRALARQLEAGEAGPGNVSISEWETEQPQDEPDELPENEEDKGPQTSS
jgi:hypothetical protein